ncbi:DsbA family protein [Luteimonas sp. BDR2-5]|uniref:DsbA family protein n=1 Tax=Proluteimonas luteida TaxID=2878685 RepID=UPI001E36CCEB|nr:DsbA family protein [Luteimonas sp. BDR2-5]
MSTTLAVPVSADDHIQGDPGAPVTLVEYGDFQCPACAMAYPLVKAIQRRHGADVAFVFRHFPLAEAHPFARLAAEVAEGAAAQGRFWDMHDWLYENQDDWVPYGAEGLEAGLRALSLDEARVAEAMRSPAVEARIRHDFMGGVRSGVNGTPGFYVNGALFQGDFDTLQQVIAEVIAQSR